MELPTINFQSILTLLRKKYQQLLMTFTSCDLCGEPCRQHLLLCQSCHEDLPLFNIELVQGDLLNWPAVNQALPEIEFDHLICLSPYQTPFSDWLSQFKYQGRFELSNLLADLLSRHYKKIIINHQHLQADVIASVPLHVSKWQQRGFNQAHLLAEAFSQQINTPYNAQLLSRKKMTASQVGQSGTLRRKNLRNIFELHLNPKNIPRHVLLIDDVVTTGATASEISRCLKDAGVKEVTVLALCLSLPD